MSFLKLCFLLCDFQLLQAIDIKPMKIIRNESMTTHIEKPIYHTWIGMLVKKHNVSAVDWRYSSTHIILINDALAVGYADAINHWDPEPDNTKAIFWRADGQTWFCEIEKYKLHPDFYVGKRTLALVYLLAPTYIYSYINWIPIAWPRSNIPPNSTRYIGINDEPGHIFQYWEDVVIYPKHECDSYYIDREGWTSFAKIAEYSCYVEPRFESQRCWHFTAKALVSESRGIFYLFGVGAGGPGCYSPSRWIHFHPFREWIQESSRPNLRSGNADQGMYDYYQDLDVKLLSRLFDTNKELHWASHETEWLYGNCWFGKEHLMYREKTFLKTKVNGTIATYSLSLYDRTYEHYTCVTLYVNCKKKTNTRWWFSKGFEQDDIDYYVRKVPYSINGTFAPKIIFLMDKYRKYHDIGTANIDFQFEFNEEADLDVQFYGRPVPPPTSSTSTTTFYPPEYGPWPPNYPRH